MLKPLGQIATAALIATVALNTAATAGEQVARRIVYNEATKSYFELRVLKKGEVYSTWPNVNKHARRFSYKGVRGRLAIVRDPQTLQFIRDNFRTQAAAWIGGRLMCNGRKLIWNDGTIQKRSQGWMWYRQWYRNKSTSCPLVPFMPVSLRAFNGKYYWQATGNAKGFAEYFVEYPTGKP